MLSQIYNRRVIQMGGQNGKIIAKFVAKNFCENENSFYAKYFRE